MPCENAARLRSPTIALTSRTPGLKAHQLLAKLIGAFSSASFWPHNAEFQAVNSEMRVLITLAKEFDLPNSQNIQIEITSIDQITNIKILVTVSDHTYLA
ncbi:hypothetical protein [Brevundimonas phoenicis]|uniref:hypothetical protein n=1 Tax=unclassified Brevundimonas TaxID=2622653 RepID=UPI00399FD24E